MADNSPQALVTKPRIDVQKYGKLPLYIVLGVIVVLLCILIYSVQVSTEKSVQAQNVVEVEPVNDDPKPLATGTGLEGLANADPVEEEEPAAPLVTVVQAPRPDAEYLSRKKELEEIRRRKAERLEKALGAPMRISVPQSNRQPAAQTVAVSAGTGTESGYGAPGHAYAASDLQGAVETAGLEVDERIEKERFGERARAAGEWALGHRRSPGNPFEVKTGSVIPGVMIMGINSDLPGQLIAQVSRNVYDTALGDHLLIPQGSRFYGVYDSRVAMGQTRLLVAWNRLIFPDGSSITLGSMPGTDLGGLSGFAGDVDNHYLKVFGSAAVMSLISGGMAFGVDSMKNGSSTNSDDAPSLRDEMGTALSSQLGQTSLQLLQRNLQIKPTLGLEPGYRFNMVVTKDIVFDRPYEAWR